MKKLVCVVMALLLMLGGIPVLADEEPNTFEPTYTKEADYTAKEWFDSSSTRALLTILLSMDYAKEDPEFDGPASLMGTSYVACDKEEETLVVTYFVEDKTYMLMYVPHLETVIYNEPYEASELIIKMTFDDMGYEYHQNSLSKILEVAGLLHDAIK